MRKSPSKLSSTPFQLSSIRPSPSAFLGICWLAACLLFPAFSSASRTQATVHRDRASHRVRSATRRRPRSARRQVVVAQHPHRTARGSTARRRRARARKYRLDATLDNIRTHTTPTKAAAASPEETAVPGSHAEVSRPPSLTGIGPRSAGPGAGSDLAVASPNVGADASQPDTSRRDDPFLTAAVPHYMPAALRGSHEVLLHQNIIADVEGLSRIQNDAQLSAMVHSGDLVALPASSAMQIDPRLPLNRRYCRPWTAKFLSDLSRAHQNLFGHPLQLTSAVRTVDFQRHLARYNGNAAPAYGDTASPHLTGQAIDLGKKGMSLHEIAWMRGVLGQMQASGKLDVEEEFEQACFHISVYKTYAPHSRLPAPLVASATPAGSPAQAADAAPTTAAIGGLARSEVARPVIARPVSESIRRRRISHHPRSYPSRSRRRRRRHRASMALLAARMR